MPTDAELRLEGAYKVVEWMRVRSEWGHTADSYSSDDLKVELDHSSLIRWLCSGNAALPEPPPVRFSRPDHEAGLNGRFEPFNVHAWPGQPNSLVVDQEGWQILEMRGPTEWVAAHRVGGTSDAPRWSASWSIRRVGDVDPLSAFPNGRWIAERLP